MAGDGEGVGKRGRSLEEEYFARRDRELIETQRRKAADAEELHKLGQALGVSDDELLAALREEGLDASQAALVYVLPALEVAWADGAVGKGERDLLHEQLRRHSDQGQPSANAIAKLDRWLSTRPPDRLFERARRAAHLAVSKVGEAERPALAKRILAEATAVAEASGGLLGLGAVSSPERRALEALAAGLRVEA
jgi:hypothetical protein